MITTTVRPARRTALAVLLAVVLAAVTGLGGLASPANAANEYWVEQHSDHTDIVVDWWAVDDVVAEPSILSGACADMSTWVPTWGAIEYVVCMAWAETCTIRVNADYPGHAARITYHAVEGQKCSVIGA